MACPDAADVVLVHFDLAGHGRRRCQLFGTHVTQPRGEARGRVLVHADQCCRRPGRGSRYQGLQQTIPGLLAQSAPRSYIPPSSPHKAIARTAPFSNTAGLICAPRRRANFVGPRACRNAGMHGCDTPCGNARLRYAFWMAGTVAIRMQQNRFRRKFEDYVRPDPQNADRRRKRDTAVAAKMARVA